jgi:hypothetical protein
MEKENEEERQKLMFRILDLDDDGELSILDLNWLREHFPPLG